MILDRIAALDAVVRTAQESDLPELLALEDDCWAKALRATEAEILHRLKTFPEGQVAIEVDGKVRAVVYTQRIHDPSKIDDHTYRTVPDLHEADGPHHQLLAINVAPEWQDRGLGDQLLEWNLRRDTDDPKTESVVAVTICRDWVRHQEEPLEQYVEKKNAQGLPYDPILRFHLMHGATILRLLPQYRPDDDDNRGWGVLIGYDLAERQKQQEAARSQMRRSERSAAEIVEEAVKSFLESPDGYDPRLSLSALGLESLDLYGLRNLLAQNLGEDLDPSFFFSYGTPKKIILYFDPEAEVSGGRLPSPVHEAFPRTAGIQPRAGAGPGAIDRTFSQIAVVGVACRFPGAPNLGSYWELLKNGVDAITETDRWPAEYYAQHEIPAHLRFGGFLGDVDLFAAAHFGISPREAKTLDPQQRLLLETSYHALENAAYAPGSLAETPTGVFTGIYTHDYEILQTRARAGTVDRYLATGNSASMAAGRLAYTYGFEGPAMSVDTACSSSLVAVHLASQSLRLGEIDLALACGVNLMLMPDYGISFAKAGMLAPDGRCKTFDASADGYVRAEGCAVVVLRRLDDALADGDHIHAVLRGTAINQDGASNGLTAPNALAQERVIRSALRRAGLEPHEIAYIEAHGTGTSLGDPVEWGALDHVFGDRREALYVGSAKTNIGHAEAAAGLAGLIKTILSLQNETIPPHLHFREANPMIDPNRIPARIPAEATPWPRGETPRRAGVSSFGFSGTNAHVIVEEAPLAEEPAADDGARLLVLSARSEEALETLRRDYQNLVAELSGDESPSCSRRRSRRGLSEICHSAAVGRDAHSSRTFAVGTSLEQIGERLKKAPIVRAGRSPEVAFLFTGQGSQYVYMGRELFAAQPVFRRAMEECDEILRPLLGESLIDVIHPEDGESPLDQTAWTQPALFAIEWSLAELWRSWGVRPSAVLGHSVGEYAAAVVSGMLSLEDGARLIAERGRRMQALPGGDMAAIRTDEASASAAIEGLPGVALAAINGPRSIVISGVPEQLAQVCARLEADDVKVTRLTVSHAFHSPMMEPMLDGFGAIARELRFDEPDIPFVSTVLGRVDDEAVAKAEYWIEQIRSPVRFADALYFLHHDLGFETFLEIGPKPILLGMGRTCLPDDVGLWLPGLRAGRSDRAQLFASLGELWTRGASIDWRAVYADRSRRRVELPGYPFASERKRFWIEAASPSILGELPDVEEADEQGPENWLYRLSWRVDERAPSEAAIPPRWLIVGEAGALASELERAGASCVVVGHEEASTKQDWERIVRGASSDQGRLFDRVVLFGGETTTALYLVQALAEVGTARLPRLWIVTRGAVSVDGEDVDPMQGPLWGLGRVIAAEHPDTACTLIDLDDEEENVLLRELALETPAAPETQIAWRAGVRYSARLVRFEEVPGTVEEVPGTIEEAARLVRFEEVPFEEVPGTVEEAPVEEVPGTIEEAPVEEVPGTWLITGGLGTLGRRTAAFLVDRGARDLLLVGRRAPNPEQNADLESLRARGAKVRTLQADVAEADDVARLVGGIDDLAGVIHAAGVMEPGVLLRQNAEHFERAAAAKVRGAWNLHRATLDRAPRHFICFSSAASLLGLAGQGSYASANAFLDALAHHRRANGLPALTINFGPWSEGGMMHDRVTEAARARLASQGIGDIEPERGMEIFGRLLANDSTDSIAQVGVMPMQWDVWLPTLPPGAGRAVYSDLGAASGPPRLLKELEETPLAERRNRLIAHVREQIADVLALDDPSSIGLRERVFDLGLDSLMAVEVKNRLNASCGCVLRATLLFDHPTVEALVEHLASGVLAELFEASGTESVEEADDVGEILATEIAELSEEDAEAALLRELENL